MLVPLSWLRDYVDIDLPPRRLAEELTMRGMEDGSVETAGAGWTDVVVGRVLEVRRHPNADTLWLTRVDVKPNRGDALSMIGLAREIAAFTGAELRLPDADVHETDARTEAHVTVQIDEPELNPRFTARWFDGVTNAQSPEWMQRRLLAAGMRPISAVVDVTNYVMHELGQPMHAYDADAIPDGEIVVRRARDGETLLTLDHAE